MKIPKTVFVPFEWKGVIRERVNDLPRFLTSKEVITFLSSRYWMRNRKLDWEESEDTEDINDYLRGVGTLTSSGHLIVPSAKLN